MATAKVQFPPSNRVVPGSHLIPVASFPSSVPDYNASPESVASDWISSFNAYARGEDGTAAKLFLPESCWRDLLCMTWDFRTVQGPQQISSLIAESPKDSRIIGIYLNTSTAHKRPQLSAFEDLTVVRACLEVETSSGRGQGVVRLLPDTGAGCGWKALTLFTTLTELKGHEENIRSRRPTGHESAQERRGQSWADKRTAELNFVDGREPTVLVLGAGQGGLTASARLKQLGLETLIIDRNPRKFTPKDKLADWFEYYVGILELNVWTSTNLASSEWSEKDRRWTIELVREKDGRQEKRIVHPRHVILATGHSGEPNVPSDIVGIQNFKGDRISHSAYFDRPSEDGHGKKAVVVGCCNSGHDIARDYYSHGYDVTMVQRSSTLVVGCDTLIDVTMKGLYEENGPPVEDADLLNFSVPNTISKRLQVANTKEMMRRDSSLLKGLADAGFAVDSGPDCSGLWMKYLHRGGGYYIDVGTSQLIVDRKIKVKQGQEIKSIKERSLVLADDSELEADEIVLATGFQNMRGTARKIFGDDVADRLSDVWGFDEEGETRVMWRRSGHPGFWFFGGNLAISRFYSRLLALQIKAVEIGLMKA